MRCALNLFLRDVRVCIPSLCEKPSTRLFLSVKQMTPESAASPTPVSRHNYRRIAQTGPPRRRLSPSPPAPSGELIVRETQRESYSFHYADYRPRRHLSASPREWEAFLAIICLSPVTARLKHFSIVELVPRRETIFCTSNRAQVRASFTLLLKSKHLERLIMILMSKYARLIIIIQLL